jgi:UDP-N-acetylmuramate--alanine ligase
LVFQPHRYTRTKALFEDFVTTLSTADVLVLLDVYAAGESPIAGADGRALCGSIRVRGEVEPVFVSQKETLYDILRHMVHTGDIILMQGAGDIGHLALGLLEISQ